LLGERLNTTHAIGNIAEKITKEERSKLEAFFENFKVVDRTHWIHDILP
jgi:hypothetical protein